jgi:hypothetical protein
VAESRRKFDQDFKEGAVRPAWRQLVIWRHAEAHLMRNPG